MVKLAFIGLGIMGSPMAINLQQAGHEVVGYNRTPERVDALVAAGGARAASIAEAVNGAAIVAVMVPDSPDVVDVLTGEQGVFAHAQPGALIIDFSSIRPDVAIQLSDEAISRGFRFLDAPVSGGEAGAKAGTLSVMVGGAAADFHSAMEVFQAVGRTIRHLGASGAGQTVKAANQLLVGGHLALLAEALTFLQAYEVDLPAAVEVLGGGLAGSAVLDQKAEKMLDREFSPGFRIDLHHKDLGIFSAAAREAGLSTPVGAIVAQIMAAARAQGHGELDHSAVFNAVASLSSGGDEPGDLRA